MIVNKEREIGNVVDLFTDTTLIELLYAIDFTGERKLIRSIIMCYRAMIGYDDNYLEFIVSLIEREEE